ncbi:MAG: hypothetical protein NTY06_02625 [Candidatus Gottesmanbacteria bacterium]|nr:hypothetical protein [Candidatus Gottesmanbacteria bacterium]
MKISSLSQGNDRDLLLVSVFTFFTITLWVFFEVLKTVKTTTLTSQVTQMIVPLSPKIDSQILQTIATKKSY